MNILVYIDKIDSLSLENLSLSSYLKEKFNGNLFCFINSNEINDILNKSDIDKIFTCNNKINFYDSSQILKTIIDKENISIILIPQDENGNIISSLISGKMDIPLYKNVTSICRNDDFFFLKQNIFSNSGCSEIKINSQKIIISICKSAFSITHGKYNNPIIEVLETPPTNKNIKVLKSEPNNNKSVSLNDAKIVISGGRGMLSADNWYLLEVLSSKLNAALACSKPVSSDNWRDHSEHVGQTGKNISPDLYIAVGISGAIQHFAGVSNSKKILVINKDPSAPFIEKADYAIIGDSIDILNQIINEIK